MRGSPLRVFSALVAMGFGDWNFVLCHVIKLLMEAYVVSNKIISRLKIVSNGLDIPWDFPWDIP